MSEDKADTSPKPEQKPKGWYQRKNLFPKGNQAAKNRGKVQKHRNTKAPRQLLDYRYVYTHPHGPFKTAALEKVKEFFDLYPKEFFAQMAALEAKYMAATEKADPLSAGGKDAPSSDEGMERALELCERWLREKSLSKLDSEINATGGSE